jgi:hypothetical protein
MKDAGARGPAAPKPPAIPVTKGASPPAPPVTAAKTIGLAAQRPPQPAPTPTPAHVQPKVTPKAPPVAVAAHVTPPPGLAAIAVPDDGWDDAPTRVEDDDVPTATLQASAKAAAIPTEDVRAIVKLAVDAALAPVLASLRDLERRIAPIERLAAAASVAPPPLPQAQARPPDRAAAAIARPASPPAAVAAPAPIAASAAPVARSPYALPTPGPVLDLAAIDRDQSIDIDMPFDGARRRRRMAVGCGMIFVLSLGGLLAILIHSYMR